MKRQGQAEREFWVGQWFGDEPQSYLTVEAVKQNFSTRLTMAAMPDFSGEIALGDPNLNPTMIAAAISGPLASHLKCLPSDPSDMNFARIIPPNNATQNEIENVRRMGLPPLN